MTRSVSWEGLGSATTIGTAAAIAAMESRLFGDGPPPPRIGRYIVQRRLGNGAFGSVYEARDPKLGRSVAVKLLRPPQTELQRRRQLREARALARLADPNVVQVFDVGTQPGDGRLYIAMEYIRGLSMRQWLDRKPQSRRRIIDTMLAAGRGLAAAHVAGLVHRDFKPENVLISARGEVKVADFGLARRITDDGELSTMQDDGIGSSFLSASLSATGQIMGTPAYMAPELIEGATATSQSDQFSFCVVLFEALLGTRPFPATAITDLSLAHEDGPAWPPHKLPASLVAVLERGLALESNDRFATMDELLRALDRSRRHGRRTRLMWGAAVLGAMGLAAPASHARLEARDDAPVASMSDPTRDAELDRLRVRIDAIESSPSVRATPDADAELLAQVRASGDDEMLARAQLALATRALHAGDYDVAMPALEEAFTAASGTDDRLATEAAGHLCQYGFAATESSSDALRYCTAGLAIAGRLQDANLRAFMLASRGWLYADLSRLDASLQDLEIASKIYEEQLGPNDERTIAVLFNYARTLDMVGRAAEAVDLNQRFIRELTKLRGPGHPSLCEAYNSLGSALMASRRFEEAIDAYERGLDIARAGLPDDDPILAMLLTNVGDAYNQAGHFAEARQALEQALGIPATSGELPLLRAAARTNLGYVLYAQGHNDEAFTEFQLAVDEAVSRAGEEDRTTAAALSGLGIALYAADRLDEASATLERVVQILDATGGKDTDKWAIAQLYLARIAVKRDEPDDARRIVAKALDSAAASSRSFRGDALRVLGWAAVKAGDWPEACEHYAASLADFEAADIQPWMARARADTGRACWRAHTSRRQESIHLVRQAIAEAEAFDRTPATLENIQQWRQWLRQHRR